MRLRIFLISSLIGPLVLLAGCQTVPAPGTDTSVNAAEAMRVSLVPPLDDHILVGQVVTGYTNGNLMTVDVTLSKPDRMPPSLPTEYKFEWMDERGRLVDSPLSRFTRQSFRHGQPVTVSGIAPTPKVTDFALILRPTTQ